MRARRRRQILHRFGTSCDIVKLRVQQRRSGQQRLLERLRTIRITAVELTRAELVRVRMLALYRKIRADRARTGRPRYFIRRRRELYVVVDVVVGGGAVRVRRACRGVMWMPRCRVRLTHAVLADTVRRLVGALEIAAAHAGVRAGAENATASAVDAFLDRF